MLRDFLVQSMEPIQAIFNLHGEMSSTLATQPTPLQKLTSHSWDKNLFERVFFLFLTSTCLKINLKNSIVNNVLASVITGCPKAIPG